MKVINLINMIALGEEMPKKIVYGDEIYTFRKDLNDYENEYFHSEDEIWKFRYLFENPYMIDFKEFFNEEIEVMEEVKKIEKITVRAGLVGSIDNKLENLDINIMAVEDKINEIIDRINKEL